MKANEQIKEVAMDIDKVDFQEANDIKRVIAFFDNDFQLILTSNGILKEVELRDGEQVKATLKVESIGFTLPKPAIFETSCGIMQNELFQYWDALRVFLEKKFTHDFDYYKGQLCDIMAIVIFNPIHIMPKLEAEEL
jgi:hypothetical protein